MNKIIDIILKGIYAGIMIAIGAVVFLATSNKIVGSLLFSIGLLTVCMYGLNLFTGKVGYILINKPTYFIELLLSLFGNFIGSYLVGFLIRNTRYSNYIEIAKELVKVKLADNFISIFILSIFCGILMFIAVNNYRKSNDLFGKYIGIFLCVMTFILCGFEHCVANIFYITIANMWSVKCIIYFIIMALGNSVGSVIMAFYYNRFYKN